ncbi:MAG: hypothetical protein ACRYFV_10940 [Janthinobacterium lividum]
MTRLFLRWCLLLSISLLGALCPAKAQNQPNLTLTILPTTYASSGGAGPTISFGRGHFHVLLTNTSAAPVTLFEEWNSWGYYGLSFELTVADGRRLQVSRKPRGWDKNFSSTFTLAPQGSYVFEVSFDQTWTNSPRQAPHTGEPLVCRLRAIYSIAPTEEPLRPDPTVHPWAGTVSSQEQTYALWP